MIKRASQENSSVLSGVTVEILNYITEEIFLSKENRRQVTNKPTEWIFWKVNEY